MSAILWSIRMRRVKANKLQGTEKNNSKFWGRCFVILIILVWLTSFLIGFDSALVILIIVGFIASVVGLWSPAIGLLGIGILVTLNELTQILLLSGGILRWNSLNYWLLIVILLFLPFLFRLNDPHSRLLQIFLLVIGLQLLISEDIGTGIQDIITIVTIFGLIVYFAHALQDDEAYYWLSVIIGVLGAVGCFVLYLQIESLPYINPNSLAAFPLTAVLTITLVYSKTERTPHRKLVLLILATVNFIWVIYPGSRGNIFIGVCSMFVLLLMTRSVSKILLILIVVVLLGYGFSSMFIEQTNFLFERLQYTFDPSHTFAQRTSGRSNIARAGLNLFSDFPFGAGTGNFRSYISTYEVVGFRARAAESGWIKTLAENGIPGILILVAYVGSFTIVGWRKRNQGMLLIGVLVTISLGVGFITKVFEGNSMFFLAAGGTVFLHRDEMIKYIHRKTNLIKERNKFKRKYDRLNRIQNDRR